MMKDNRRPAGWPMMAGIAGVAVLAGFGLARVLAPGQQAAAPATAAAAPEKPGTAEVKIPAEYLASANIVVEPVATTDVGSEILAPATVVAAPGSEAVIVARASGVIQRINRRPGEAVRAGEVLALVDSPDAAAMAAERRVATAKTDLARKTYAREASLHQQGVTARQDMEGARAALETAEAEAQRAATVAQAAHLASDGRSIAVVSPIAGKVTARSAILGAYVTPQAELFRVAGSSAAEVEASVTAADVARVTPGDEAVILTSTGAPVPARVHAVTPTVDGSARTATVVLKPTQASDRLVIGEGVQVRLRTRANGSNALSVPEDAVQNLDGHDVLFVRTPQGFRAQAVLVGTRSGGAAQILSGVRAGEPVATRNAFLLKAEMNKGAGDDE
ncbi:efflux RND transporter periplasmic adaptor subunit [Ralstonia pickettii]|uniref:Efflux RND transporter periplasmic adaptor subunit n=1 Tax=Ralstonia pickettii TaxID=329 RepID=A0A7X2LAG1_RALPI|nr:efflux RND transporter periplasmic adaptor subunit [Ralstonia pickettii]MRS98072.1 efflux RND transporter periplasmic adaptor subunit [Ralstonia pickettii]